MSETHWKKTFDPRFLGSCDFEPGQDKILTIKVMKREECTFEGGRKENCNIAYWVEDEKPMIMNVTNCKTINKLTGTPYMNRWAGLRIQIYVDPKVKFKGEETEGLRIRSKLPEDAKIACEECGQFITPAFSMSATQMAAYTKKKYGMRLCADCAKEKKEEKQDGTEQQ